FFDMKSSCVRHLNLMTLRFEGGFFRFQADFRRILIHKWNKATKNTHQIAFFALFWWGSLRYQY
ncbi:MAG: hypothetical protein ACI4LP_11990, partial [Anaerovoracaceae bacterium]